MVLSSLKELYKLWENEDTVKYYGYIKDIVGLTIEVEGLYGRIGELCFVKTNNGYMPSEIVGFSKERAILMMLTDMIGIKPGDMVISTGRIMDIGVGNALLGRIIDGLGKPLDGKGIVPYEYRRSIASQPPDPLKRKPITDIFQTSVKSIDGFLTVGKGQRIGIFAGSGVGKSVLLGMMAKYAKADVNVIGLIGERGREVREFIERDLGEGIRKSVVVVATSDKPALLRVKSAMVATTIAEYFRDMGKSVLLMIDSITRVAMAQREIGLAVGEPPTTRGYTPSVFSMLPSLLERSGNSDKGSITGIYTVLVENDDMNEPVADACRSILDGHIVLSRKLAHRNQYPAVDVLASISRVMPSVVDKEHLNIASRLREMIAEYTAMEDMIEIGAYEKGKNKRLDDIINRMPSIIQFLKQNTDEHYSIDETIDMMRRLLQ